VHSKERVSVNDQFYSHYVVLQFDKVFTAASPPADKHTYEQATTSKKAPAATSIKLRSEEERFGQLAIDLRQELAAFDSALSLLPMKLFTVPEADDEDDANQADTSKAASTAGCRKPLDAEQIRYNVFTAHAQLPLAFQVSCSAPQGVE
jgi:hypothetical protein